MKKIYLLKIISDPKTKKKKNIITIGELRYCFLGRLKIRSLPDKSILRRLCKASMSIYSVALSLTFKIAFKKKVKIFLQKRTYFRNYLLDQLQNFDIYHVSRSLQESKIKNYIIWFQKVLRCIWSIYMVVIINIFPWSILE